MSWRQTDWYDTPRYYDLIFDADTEREVAFLEGIWQRHGHAATSTPCVLEPACGSGRLIAAMAGRGWKTVGFDASAAMLDFARQRCASLTPAPLLWQDRMESFVLPKSWRGGGFHLAHCLVSTFKYLQTETQAQDCLRRLRDALRPGGLLILGLHLSDYQRTRCEHERWVVRQDQVEVVCNTRTWPADRRRRLEALRNRLRVTDHGRTHQQETRWHFRTYNAAQLRRTLQTAVPDLRLVACHNFHYDLEDTRQLDDAYADIIVVLKKS
ncbi:MAG: class I SAM-dependent methyltransferase [Verrucomicrobiales bacterium]|nr:class I SAM-dependent methyltransferase [Verrucomicrobiales bacterium]